MTDKVNTTGRQDCVVWRFLLGHRRCAGNDAAMFVYVCAGEYRNDARQGLGRVSFDSIDFSVGERAAQDERVQQASELKVVHVGGDAFDQARVLDALDRLSEVTVLP